MPLASLSAMLLKDLPEITMPPQSESTPWYAPLWDYLNAEVFTRRPGCKPGQPLFNLYLSDHPSVDLPGAHLQRRDNLNAYLRFFTASPPLLLVGEAPGWRGARFSGVPFTSEAQLTRGEVPFEGCQTSAQAAPLHETTAAVYWAALGAYAGQALAWNSLPFHPHREDDILSNRTPNLAELRQHATILSGVIEQVHPRRVIAIGQKASQLLREIGLDCLIVRHPAHGGSQQFASQIREILKDAHGEVYP
jgi:hypothetical protein